MDLLDAFGGLIAATSGGPAIYVVVALAAAIDPILPPIPAETALITAAVLSSRSGGPLIWLLVPAGALGAVVGDNVVYWLGRSIGERAIRRLAGGPKATERLRWATEQIRRHGPVMIVVGRYLPGGRTAATLGAGTLGMPWRRFVLADVVAGLTWSAYASALGRVGGAAFEHSTWKAIALALGLAAALALALEAWRRLHRRA
ncbi:MAG TPA: DedA family protein [Candidatus Dormibacteraeota bacterium]|jgi:membrane-associated protein|nr:DedA family protein [Candidatus Dormibacteraeota bacterium]